MDGLFSDSIYIWRAKARMRDRFNTICKITRFLPFNIVEIEFQEDGQRIRCSRCCIHRKDK